MINGEVVKSFARAASACGLGRYLKRKPGCGSVPAFTLAYECLLRRHREAVTPTRARNLNLTALKSNSAY